MTQLDGLVYSRNAKYHSANYRCVMCFDRGSLLKDGSEKRAMSEAMTSRYIPRRTAGRDCAPATDPRLATTSVIEVLIEEITAKRREGGPKGPNDPADDGLFTRGVVDLRRDG